MLAFGAMGFLLSLAIIGVSLLLIGLILLQKNRGSGLSGAFGGVGGHSAFGTKTGDFLTWVTVSLAAVFLILSVAATFVFEPEKAVAKPAPVLSPDGTGVAVPIEDQPDASSPAAPVSTSPPAAAPSGSGTNATGSPAANPAATPPASATDSPAPVSPAPTNPSPQSN